MTAIANELAMMTTYHQLYPWAIIIVSLAMQNAVQPNKVIHSFSASIAGYKLDH